MKEHTPKAKCKKCIVVTEKGRKLGIPVGCRACGGPYPLCKDGCPLFDD